MRKRIYEVIEVAREDDRFSAIYDGFMIVMIVLSLVPLLFKETTALLTALDRAAVVVFIIDYLLRWVTADYKFGKPGVLSFLRYPFSLMAIIDLLSILPSLTVLNAGFKVLRMLRMMRALRVLRVLKAVGVKRISINPQTFSDAVLNAVGRRHTAAEIEEKYLLARSLGFDNINMDLIAGLPGDTPEGFAASVDKAVSLGPENITVHTLALKRAADLANGAPGADFTPQMVEYAGSALSAAGYGPYYMYRQSKSLGNLENVGWAKPGRDCLYNIYMMEETHSVLACGAGAVIKLRQPAGELIERVYNFKYPYEYISRFPELLARKARITEFYGE